MQDFTGNEKFMTRCLDLALQGKGKVAPNPMVGSVIVQDNTIIGEGFHQGYGMSHAEVNAIRQVANARLLESSTLYVNLEPCSHFGKTPPCSNLIIEKKIPRVVIGSSDPNLLVKGKGIEHLKQNGVAVTCGILEERCMMLNKRFFTWHMKKRPYIILKWARSADGFIDFIRSATDPIGPNWITSQRARILVHKWRTEEQAIMVGTNTVLKDNPRLNIRDWSGKNPLRVITDRNLRVGKQYNVLDNSQETIVFTQKTGPPVKEVDKLQPDTGDPAPKTRYIRIDFQEAPEIQMLDFLYTENIQSVIIEGGSFLLNRFIERELWDEARIFTGPAFFRNGVKSPEITGKSGFIGMIDNSLLQLIYNNSFLSGLT
jgi:diaminohydroxyphosphoribosylaminopyrimidine deaminase / 5-amino-6-(5-phosphoribosylamino)uracil reductase